MIYRNTFLVKRLLSVKLFYRYIIYFRNNDFIQINSYLLFI